MTTLLTGANGFVGSAVARVLIEAGHEVRALVRPGSDRRNLQGLAIDIVHGDLRDITTLRGALSGCEALFHVAADYRLWALHSDELYESNVQGSLNVMRAALERGVKRIVYTSSVATLGINRDGRPADEETPVRLGDMIGDYKRSKYLAEEEVKRLVREQGLPAVIVNPSTPIGPRDYKPTPTGRMVRDAVQGRMPAYVDTGLNLVHVDDVAHGHRLAYERGRIGERYILGGENLSLRVILEEIARLAGRRPPRWRLPHGVILPVAHLFEAWAYITRGSEPRVTVTGVRLAKKHMYFSSDKARRELGYDPRPVGEALRAAVDWFKRGDGYR
jgi:dihydroflavonol-4-reductase